MNDTKENLSIMFELIMRCMFLLLAHALITTTASSNCPDLSYSYSPKQQQHPPLLHFSSSNKSSNVCFNVSKLFHSNEEILRFECTLHATGQSINESPLSQKSEFGVTVDYPFVFCPIPPSNLPSINLLIVSMRTSWFITTYEHWIYSGIPSDLEVLQSGARAGVGTGKRNNQLLKINLGSGTALLNAKNYWINFDLMPIASNPTGQGFDQDSISASFQQDLYSDPNHSHHLVRWDSLSKLIFFPDNHVDIVHINCVLGINLNNRGPGSVQAIIRDIYRVLKVGGIVRIGDRTTTDLSYLRSVIIEAVKEIFGGYRNLGPFRTYTGDVSTLHVTHSNCVNCMKTMLEREKSGITFDTETNYTIRRKYNDDDNNKIFEESVVQQGCWICHVDIRPHDEQEVQNCEMNNYQDDGCQHLGRIGTFQQPSSFSPFFAVEAIKQDREGTVSEQHVEDMFDAREEKGLLIDYSASWP